MNNDKVIVCCHDFYMNVRAFAMFSLAAMLSFGTLSEEEREMFERIDE